MHSLRLGAAGMRGEVGPALTPRLAMDFAAALGTYIDGGPVVLACDTRISSAMFHHAALAALMGCGCEVLDAGVVSAPELHFMVPYLHARAGLLIGAGHHPMGWNALTPVRETGAFFTSTELQELLDIYHSRRYRQCLWNAGGRRNAVPVHAREGYLSALCDRLDTKAIAQAGFTVITDFCNGSGSIIADAFALCLGIRMHSINKELWGVLPHDPEPRPRTSMQVKSLIKPMQADIGFTFNSDMSRAAVVTSEGETLSEEYTVALVADRVMAGGGKTMVTNWCTTRTLDEIVLRHEGRLHKTKVGEAYIIDRMAELKADLAGDGSGSAAFGGHIPGYDNFMVMGVILESMARRQCTSDELARRLPRYHIVKRALPTSSSHAYSILRSIPDYFPDAAVSEEDGFRFDWPDGWVHLRASMTEPIIRMIVEWNTREGAEDRALQVRGLLERLGAS